MGNQASGISLVGIMVGLGISMVTIVAASKYVSDQRRASLAIEAREATQIVLKFLNRDLTNRFRNHRHDEAGQVISPCGEVRHKINFLRQSLAPADVCSSAVSRSTDILTTDPASASGQALPIEERERRGSKVVIEELYQEGGLPKVKRTEYETVCVPIPPNTSFDQVRFSRISSLTDQLTTNGCFNPSSCSLGANSTVGILVRQSDDWNDDNDLNGAYDWSASSDSAYCIPKQILRPTDDKQACELKPNVSGLLALPLGAALCGWTDDLDDPTMLSARGWAFYANNAFELSMVRENINIFHSPIGSGGPTP